MLKFSRDLQETEFHLRTRILLALCIQINKLKEDNYSAFYMFFFDLFPELFMQYSVFIFKKIFFLVKSTQLAQLLLD